MRMSIKFAAAAAMLGALLLMGNGRIMANSKANEEENQVSKNYSAGDFSKLLGTPGFSDTLLNNHFKLYQGYVNNTNGVMEKLSALLADGKEKTPEYAELKRRFGWEFNGMRLHEFYFANIGGKKPVDPKGKLFQKIVEEFGSFENWTKDFKATGLMRGIGWVVLYQDGPSGRLINAWINEHDVGHPAGASPILIMDVFEHAYITDYQLDRAKYIEAFFNAINWEEIGKRLK
jgi:superoxide dismutase, Fe-Mn family